MFPVAPSDLNRREEKRGKGKTDSENGLSHL